MVVRLGSMILETWTSLKPTTANSPGTFIPVFFNWQIMDTAEVSFAAKILSGSFFKRSSLPTVRLPDSSFNLKEVLRRIEGYRELSRSDYLSNLVRFLNEIVPAAESAGITLALHPDDPPWPLLGLPRAVSTLQDAEEIIQSVDSPSNGLTFCTGSFGAAPTNDLPLMAKKLAHRINFLHLRNVKRDEQFNFHETDLFAGDVDMVGILKTMIQRDIRRTEARSNYSGIPIRPDHGARILGDFNENYYPGYTLYGRLKNLAGTRGMELGIRAHL